MVFHLCTVTIKFCQIIFFRSIPELTPCFPRYGNSRNSHAVRICSCSQSFSSTDNEAMDCDFCLSTYNKMSCFWNQTVKMAWPQAQQIWADRYNGSFRLGSHNDLQLVIIKWNMLHHLIGSAKCIYQFENQRTARWMPFRQNRKYRFIEWFCLCVYFWGRFSSYDGFAWNCL